MGPVTTHSYRKRGIKIFFVCRMATNFTIAEPVSSIVEGFTTLPSTNSKILKFERLLGWKIWLKFCYMCLIGLLVTKTTALREFNGLNKYGCI